jgi:hypothetical protein
MSYTHWRRQRNWGVRVREFSWLGMRALSLENERLRISVLVDKGSDVFEFLYKPCDLDFVWLTANGFRDPRHVLATAAGDAAGAFIDSYGGGWQEVLPNGGAPSIYAGASFGQHGEIALLPWDYELIEDSEQAVVVRMSVACLRTPLRLVKELRLEAGSARLEVSESIVNDSPVDVELMWGHHLVFGAPFLAPGARIALPDGIRGIPHEEPITGGPRRVAPEGFRWPHTRSPDGDPVDLSVLTDEGRSSDIMYLSGFPEAAWVCVSAGTHASCHTCGSGRSSMAAPTIRGTGGTGTSAWSRSQATRRTGSRMRSRTVLHSCSPLEQKGRSLCLRRCCPSRPGARSLRIADDTTQHNATTGRRRNRPEAGVPLPATGAGGHGELRSAETANRFRHSGSLEWGRHIVQMGPRADGGSVCKRGFSTQEVRDERFRLVCVGSRSAEHRPAADRSWGR